MMRIIAILTIFVATLLSGCTIIDSHALANEWRGKTYEQLVAAHGREPTRTYTSKDGNKVVVYFYYKNVDYPTSCDKHGCSGGYSYCEKREHHLEIVNGVISRFGLIVNVPEWANRYPIYSNSACNSESQSISGRESSPYSDNPF